MGVGVTQKITALVEDERRKKERKQRCSNGEARANLEKEKNQVRKS